MNAYYVISRDFAYAGADGIFAEMIQAHSEKKAWEIVEEQIARPASQDWLLDKASLKKLKMLCDALLTGDIPKTAMGQHTPDRTSRVNSFRQKIAHLEDVRRWN